MDGEHIEGGCGRSWGEYDKGTLYKILKEAIEYIKNNVLEWKDLVS